MLQDAHFCDETVTVNREPGESYMRRNYEICQAVNLTNMSVALDKLEKAGMPKEQAACFRAAGEALLQLIRTENNRLYAAALTTQSKG